ncbi:hypothetical protein ABZP36_002301 [Zizania latifolia]
MSMTGHLNLGNHGGGECGIPYSVKFRMPGNSFAPTGTGAPDTSNLFCSFDSGVVHFIYMSTETDFVQGSDQDNLIKATPFVVFQGHRPISTSRNEARDFAMKLQMVQNLEPLLVRPTMRRLHYGEMSSCCDRDGWSRSATEKRHDSAMYKHPNK